MIFWWAHHQWSRRFGLEEGVSVLLSLTLVATVLVYMYPLRLIFQGFFANFSNGALPAPWAIELHELGPLFVVFGAGFALMSFIIAALNFSALRLAGPLNLNAFERHETRAEMLVWLVVGATGFGSMLFAALMPAQTAPAAGYFYWSLAVRAPLLGFYLDKKAPRRKAE